jgi:hypothetical protein
MSKEVTIEAKSNVFNFDALKLKDQKIVNKFISPDFNPGALKRLRSKNNLNVGRKYTVQKELYYEDGNKKVWLSIGDTIQFIKEHV